MVCSDGKFFSCAIDRRHKISMLSNSYLLKEGTGWGGWPYGSRYGRHVARLRRWFRISAELWPTLKDRRPANTDSWWPSSYRYCCMDVRSRVMLLLRTIIETRRLQFRAASLYWILSEPAMLGVVGSYRPASPREKRIYKRRNIAGKVWANKEAKVLTIP